MKVEPLISRFLYQNKKVTLQNIGTFYLSSDVFVDADPEKNVVLPENAITFEYNKNAQPDDSLIAFIMEQTRKIKPLAASDLESFCMLSAQFLNIGKPLEIKGLGFLQKNQSGQYEFTQGDTIDNKLTDLAVHSEHTEDSGSPNFSTPVKNKTKNKWLLPFSLIVLTLGGMIYMHKFYSKKEDTSAIPQPSVNTTSIAQDTAESGPTDTLKSVSDTAISFVHSTDSGFRIIVKEYNTKKQAENSLKKLTSYGHPLLLNTIDSTNYQLFLPFANPITDTTKVKDSLKRYFGERIYVGM